MLLVIITLMVIPMVVLILGASPQILILVLTRQRMIMLLTFVATILHLPQILLRTSRVGLIVRIIVVIVPPNLLVILLILNLKVLKFVLDDASIPLDQVYNPGQQN